MPAQAASSDSSDVGSKYSHLLQPIRDLTKNWDVDVAAQLEEYLAEVKIDYSTWNFKYRLSLSLKILFYSRSTV